MTNPPIRNVSSRCKRCECERVGCNHMPQRIEKQIGAVAAVKSKRHFVQIGLQVLRADAMPCSNDSALQERESRFDSVGMNVRSKPDVLFRGVVHGLMLE